MKAGLPLTILFITASLYGFSQKGHIEGSIFDADSRIPVDGASIDIDGTGGDNSDIFGRFSIPDVYPGQYEMIVSHIGYKTEIITVEIKPYLRSSVNISLRRVNIDLSAVTVNSKRNSALQTLGALDIRLRPINTSQDILRMVPGLFIAQHAGGGKAEQIFLRGYDIDHGTDINISVDGIPVNMVSHAHGQGYADLHFLIPEMVEKLTFEKGPYFSGKGNLATAAYVEFNTRDFLEQNNIKFEIADFNSWRTMGQFKVFNKQTDRKRQQFYLASEYSTTDGYFESPQDFHRFNLMGKYNLWLDNQSRLTILASTFDSRWNASGQVPDRAVRTKVISRFGAIDHTEGGHTSRTNFSIRYHKNGKNNWMSIDQLYFSNYHFNLYSNFTFFLADTVNGDMINQRESRNIAGYTTSKSKSHFIGNKKARTELGAGWRIDLINDIALSKTVQRQFLGYIQLGDLRERNCFLFINQDLELGEKWNLNAGLRYDHFNFRYKDKLAGATELKRQSRGNLSPKLNLSFSATPELKFYLYNGFGFHSNDTRVILYDNAKEILPRVYGTDLGLIAKPHTHIIFKTAIWHLYSQQEFVYVGDAGIVEPSGKTRRLGIDISARVQFNKWLFGDLDINLTRARATGVPKGMDFVPLAPSFTSLGGLTARTEKGLSGSLRYRLTGSRPANEINSIRADGYFLADLVGTYKFKKFELTVSVENMTNREWRDAQFDTESKLKFETDPVSEIHYTPGIPRFFKAGINFSF